ncbi:MAG: hypothetical protein KDB10_20295 [Acidimicrobiales bacterium]|nr:hypothetical protein [Acidimicrobiales bacterium]
MNRTIRTATTLACIGLLGGIGAACGDDAGASAPPTTVGHEHTSDDHDAMTVEIDGVDYRFEHVPESVPAGTRLSFTNRSAKELHELVAFRVDTDEPLDDLLALPQDELERQLGIPTAVLVQPPGAPEAFAAVGDGTLTEPGRYVLLCTIPQGADPEAYVAAAQAAQGGRPEGFDGAPHFTLGMAAEVTAE